MHSNAATVIDHSAWGEILRAYVVPSGDGVTRFAYGRVSDADRQKLKAYLATLQTIEVSELDESEQQAVWINLYNALTIDVVLDHYPVASVQEIALGHAVAVPGPWGAPLVSVEGRLLSLNDIEHDVLRKTWRDPRVHYAVNCASMSCPSLAMVPYSGADLDLMLDDSARNYVNHPRAVFVGDDGVRLSQIYSWYRRDFGGDATEVLAHIRRYALPPLLQALTGIDRIAGYRYDWSLNDAI